MLKLQGIAVSPGVTIGEALVLDAEGFRIPRRFVARSAVDTELERLSNAVAATTREIERNRDAVQAELGGQSGWVTMVRAGNSRVLRLPGAHTRAAHDNKRTCQQK